MKSYIILIAAVFYSSVSMAQVDVKVTADGNMGIGTETPGSTKLVIRNTGDGVSLLKLESDVPWEFYQTGIGNQATTILGFRPLNNNRKFSIQASDYSEIATFYASTEVNKSWIRLLPNSGRVSIGSTSAYTGLPTWGSVDLSVEGIVMADSYYGDDKGNWPDYVFEASYELPDLSDVEKFIKNEGHLPDVPSAADVKKDGINIVETEVLLLKKVEELTLYMIELKKENAEIKEQLEELKGRKRRKTEKYLLRNKNNN